MSLLVFGSAVARNAFWSPVEQRLGLLAAGRLRSGRAPTASARRPAGSAAGSARRRRRVGCLRPTRPAAAAAGGHERRRRAAQQEDGDQAEGHPDRPAPPPRRWRRGEFGVRGYAELRVPGRVRRVPGRRRRVPQAACGGVRGRPVPRIRRPGCGWARVGWARAAAARARLAPGCSAPARRAPNHITWLSAGPAPARAPDPRQAAALAAAAVAAAPPRHSPRGQYRESSRAATADLISLIRTYPALYDGY